MKILNQKDNMKKNIYIYEENPEPKKENGKKSIKKNV